MSRRIGWNWENLVYHVPLIKNYKNLAIMQLEMLNIMVALKIFAGAWCHQKIHVKCNNLAVVQVLKSGRTRDPFLGVCAHNVWMLAAHHDIDIKFHTYRVTKTP